MKDITEEHLNKHPRAGRVRIHGMYSTNKGDFVFTPRGNLELKDDYKEAAMMILPLERDALVKMVQNVLNNTNPKRFVDRLASAGITKGIDNSTLVPIGKMLNIEYIYECDHATIDNFRNCYIQNVNTGEMYIYKRNDGEERYKKALEIDKIMEEENSSIITAIQEVSEHLKYTDKNDPFYKKLQKMLKELQLK